MRFIYTFVKLKVKEKRDCNFCGIINKSTATYLLRTSDTEIGKSIAINYLCDNCKERFDNNQMIKCECGRIKKTLAEKCLCVFLKENNINIDSSDDDSSDDYEQIELEKQIDILNEEKKQLTEEVKTHLEALEVSEVWNKKQKQELIDEIERLKREVEKLKKQTPQELVREIEELKTQLEKFTSQQTAQIEVKETKKWPWRLKK